MKNSYTKVLLIFFFGLMSCSTGSSFAADEAETFVVELSNPGEPATLEIENSFMQLVVIGADRDDMEFRIERKQVEIDYSRIDVDVIAFGVNDLIDPNNPGRSPNRDISGLRRIDSTPGFVVEELNNEVKFEAGFEGSGYRAVVLVPLQTALKLQTINAGKMSVTGVTGDHELANVNGAISALDLSGSVSAETANGAIDLVMLQVNADTPMAFSSINGDIDITLPADYQANVRIDSGRGNTYTNFDIDIDRTPPRVESTQGSRGRRIEVKRELRGVINGGGPMLQIETFNGSVYLRKLE